MGGEYKVVYDAIEQGIPWYFYLVIVAMCVVYGLAAKKYRAFLRMTPSPAFQIIVLALWLSGMTFLMPMTIIEMFKKQLTCIDWLKTGQYFVKEGQVENYYKGPEFDSFDLGSWHFRYHDSDLIRGCFHDSHGFGGPDLGGKQVRIAHRRGIILKIEVLDEQHE